uniref:Uncharacterized protein n=1 Tax=Oryza rufipogon TaxID=4529 RepID=A0A0E0NNJ2_ORYRU
MDNLYEDLQIRERNPIPSLYSAQGDGVYAEVIVKFIGSSKSKGRRVKVGRSGVCGSTSWPEEEGDSSDIGGI